MSLPLKIVGALKAVSITVGGLLVLGFGISGQKSMPDYAVVFLDDLAKTYIALPCMEEWHSRPSKEFAAVRRATAGEARRLKYDPDVTCREASGFVDDDHSLSGS